MWWLRITLSRLDNLSSQLYFFNLFLSAVCSPDAKLKKNKINTSLNYKLR